MQASQTDPMIDVRVWQDFLFRHQLISPLNGKKYEEKKKGYVYSV